MRKYNMIGRGERETVQAFVKRAQGVMAARIPEFIAAPFGQDALLDVPFGAIEARDDSLCFLAADGESVVAKVRYDAPVSETIQSFGGFGNATLRVVIDPMTKERALKIVGASEMPRNFLANFSADELEAVAYLMRHGA